ncbi:hypothetical protein K6119_04160 [Paracrocinitomix mangrovi]|uniref:hypothetical protein n=1 Tax=Paracrocinitomix mangrovi TaxID=2862509 RepID=UPI001C8EA9BD|nr:hypothetical protein [Paracrocinitomix mangrovi]UKN02707.1 hypothetical protein K6119_04160 [Paracrocinitomix mangrovi]
MKTFTYILLLLIIATGSLSLSNCSSPKEDKLIHNYYDYYNNKNYKELSKLLSDTIKLFDEGYLVLEGKEKFLDIVKWGEVFNSKNTLISLENKDGAWIATEKQSSDRINFLYGHDLKSETIFRLFKKKIVSIESNLIDFNAEKENKKMHLFIDWVKNNHSELMQNIWQLNSQGAKDFKKAMELYQNK